MRRVRAHAQSDIRPRQRFAECLSACALFVLLLVVAMRPLVAETYESGLHDIAQALGPTGSPSPTTTVWFDLAIWAAIVAATLGWVLAGRRWDWTGTEVAWLVLLIAAAISTCAASNQRSAITASADWLSALAMLPVLVNLLRDRFRVALLLAVLTASGVASAARCAMQTTVEFAETRQWYEQNKTQIWGRQGVDLDDPRVDRSMVELFERRLTAAEPSGFFHHSNIQGAWLVIAGFAALSLAALAGPRRPAGVLATLLALLLLASIWPTGSRGALLAGGSGLALGLVVTHIRPWLARHWRAALAATWCVILAAAAGVWALGSARGGLPGDSLRFRWNYWQTTSDVIAQHLTTGVGALNFDRAYLAFKPIAFPEEIKDPHNFVLAVLAQWGIVGGIGLGLLLWTASLRIARTLAHPDHPDTAMGGGPPPLEVGDAMIGRHGSSCPPRLKTWATQPQNRCGTGFNPCGTSFNPCGTGFQPVDLQGFGTGSNAHRSPARWIITLIAGFILLRLACLYPTWAGGAEGAALTFFDLGFYGLLWIACFALLLWLTTHRWGGATQEKRGRSSFFPWAACGVLAFLLHNTIDLAMFHPGTLTAFVALSAVAMRTPARPATAKPTRDPDPTRDRKGAAAHVLPRVPSLALLPLATALVALSGFIVLDLVPVSRCAWHLALARAATSAEQAVEHYETAAAADPLDPTPLAELAELPELPEHLAAADHPDALTAALAVADRALHRDPRQTALHRLRARILLGRFELAGDEADLLRAIGTTRTVLDLYPNSPNDHLQLAELLARAASVFPPADCLAEARQHYRAALALDDARAPAEIRRWPPARRRWVAQRLQELVAPSATAPASQP